MDDRAATCPASEGPLLLPAVHTEELLGFPALLPSRAQCAEQDTVSISHSRVLPRREEEGREGTGLVAAGHLGAEELVVTFEGGARGDPGTQWLQSPCPMGGQRASSPGSTSQCLGTDIHMDTGLQFLCYL